MRTFKAFPRFAGWLSRWPIARTFARNQDGSISVEMGFATILFVTLLTGVISVGSLFFVQGSMSDAARDAVRRLATGEMTKAEAEAYAQNKLINWGMTYTVTADKDGTDATVNITVPMGEAALINYLDVFSSGELAATVTMPDES